MRSRRPVLTIASLLGVAASAISCGGRTTTSPSVVPQSTPVPAATTTEVFSSVVLAGGSIEHSIHRFTMAGSGVAQARLLEFSPRDSLLEIVLCRGDFLANRTCGPFSSGFETDVVRASLPAGVNTVYVTKRRGDNYGQDSRYTLELVRPR